jgi:hypothetical protein
MSRESKFTTGRSVFYDSLTGAKAITDIRFSLELKLAICMATGGSNGSPVMPDRIKNPEFRSLISYGMLLKEWSLKDVAQCTDRLEGAAALVLVNSFEKPVWGWSDVAVLGAIEKLESYQEAAWEKGITL